MKHRSQQVGLYEVTTTSRPATGEELLKADDPLPRVREWLSAIGTAIVEIRRQPKKYSEAVRVNAEECSVALAKLHALMLEIEHGARVDLGTVAAAIERGADLATQWEQLRVNAVLEKPVKAQRRIGDAGRRNNQDRELQAQERVRREFDEWCRSQRNAADLAALSAADRLHKYFKKNRLPDRTKRRLRAMLRAGKIK